MAVPYPNPLPYYPPMPEPGDPPVYTTPPGATPPPGVPGMPDIPSEKVERPNLKAIEEHQWWESHPYEAYLRQLQLAGISTLNPQADQFQGWLAGPGWTQLQGDYGAARAGNAGLDYYNWMHNSGGHFSGLRPWTGLQNFGGTPAGSIPTQVNPYGNTGGYGQYADPVSPLGIPPQDRPGEAPPPRMVRPPMAAPQTTPSSAPPSWFGGTAALPQSSDATLRFSPGDSHTTAAPRLPAPNPFQAPNPAAGGAAAGFDPGPARPTPASVADRMPPIGTDLRRMQGGYDAMLDQLRSRFNSMTPQQRGINSATSFRPGRWAVY